MIETESAVARAKLAEAKELVACCQQGHDALLAELDRPDSQLSLTDIERELAHSEDNLLRARHNLARCQKQARLCG